MGVVGRGVRCGHLRRARAQAGDACWCGAAREQWWCGRWAGSKPGRRAALLCTFVVRSIRGISVIMRVNLGVLCVRGKGNRLLCVRVRLGRAGGRSFPPAYLGQEEVTEGPGLQWETHDMYPEVYCATLWLSCSLSTFFWCSNAAMNLRDTFKC